jgi:5-hydroxyisourate hydrolase
MSPITTHVLDTSRGRPAGGIEVVLERETPGTGWTIAGRGTTNADGRVADLLAGALEAGVYRLTFETAAYFAARQVASFYPRVIVVFEIREPQQHHHVPLLLSPYGYSTYRGS